MYSFFTPRHYNTAPSFISLRKYLITSHHIFHSQLSELNWKMSQPNKLLTKITVLGPLPRTANLWSLDLLHGKLICLVTSMLRLWYPIYPVDIRPLLFVLASNRAGHAEWTQNTTNISEQTQRLKTRDTTEAGAGVCLMSHQTDTHEDVSLPARGPRELPEGGWWLSSWWQERGQSRTVQTGLDHYLPLSSQPTTSTLPTNSQYTHRLGFFQIISSM